MNRKRALISGTALGCMALASCGGNDTSSYNYPPEATNPPLPPTQLDTASVLTLARQSSETTDPFAVDGGVVEVIPPDDQTSDPISIDAT